MNNIGILLIIAAGGFLLYFLTDRLARRWLKVDTPFSWVSHPVNDRHRQIDWTLRAVFIFALLISAVFFTSDRFPEDTWFYVLMSYIVLGNVMLELIRAYMQKKHSKQENEYKLTLIQVAYMAIFGAALMASVYFNIRF